MLFGEDKEGVIWVFAISVQAWKGVAFWCAIVFLLEAPDVAKGLQTAAINLGIWVVVLWLARAGVCAIDMVFRKRHRD